ncbi:hypothetical protein ANN_03703 [Periplaneta americana]|uniref:Uncharacterized protein n=1 Tax=Periplaneta americana TaxID=6978 RepID=A0ABQ8TZS0_PERAM|nr:hypothetical protein ANN_03703 [Periplaneta americana]
MAGLYPTSSVGRAAGYGLEGRGSIPGGDRIFLVAKLSERLRVRNSASHRRLDASLACETTGLEEAFRMVQTNAVRHSHMTEQ